MPVQDLSEDRDLRHFPTFDSLGVLELLVWLEGRFLLSIPDEELLVENFTTIGKIADYVTRRSEAAVND
jgi:acyl carrier protein